jgi:hypothetical protein
MVIGCIDYSFTTDPFTHHQTWFIEDFIRMDDVPIDPDEGTISCKVLDLRTSGLGQYAD